MHLANPHFVFGLIGVAVPILIYLFTRQRIKQVAFSTLRFFAGASSLLVRRKKTHEMILLAMRALACALLAIAFARPFFAPKDTSQDGLMRAGTARVIVADVSASMNRGDLPDQLRRGVIASLQDMPGDSAVALVTFDQSPHVLSPLTRDVESARQAAATLSPGQGSTDISAAIRKADELLRMVNSPTKEIVCISDLQRTGWERFRGDWNLPADEKLVVRALSTEKGNPLTILAADCPQSVVAENAPRSLTVRVGNESSEPARDIPVTLTVDGKVVQTSKLTVPAKGQAAVRFRYSFTQPGDNAGVIAVAGGDAPQRLHYFNTRLIPKIRVLILTDSTGDAKSRDGVFFLRTALTPSVDSPFVTELARPDAVTPAQLQQAAVVILADVAKVPAATRSALTNVLARGGGLLFLPGAQTQADAFNTCFGEMAPARLRRAIPASSGRRRDSKAIVSKIDYDHPVFEMFQRPHYGDFSAVAFDQYWEVTDSQLCRVSARFDDGRPMLLEKSTAGGISMMMVCPVDLNWSNLPLRAIFVPYAHEVMRYLSMRTENQTAFVVGGRLPIPKGLSLRDPEGKVHEGEAMLAPMPGLYQLVDSQGKVSFCYAVNEDRAEADVTAVEPNQIIAALQREAATPQTGAAATVEDGRNSASRKEMWAYLVGALAVLLVAELFVANRTAEQ